MAQPLFLDMNEKQVARVLQFGTIQSYPRETILFKEGDRPDFLHLLIGGIAELYKGESPHECGLVLLTQGDVFMPAASLFDEPYLNSARTLTSATVLLLRADVARQELTRCHQFAINVSRVLAGQFRMATRQIIDLKCRSAPQRLAAFLLRLIEESDIPEAAVLPVSKRHLASRVGIAPETLSRTFQILADNGLFVRGTKVLVRDREKIDEFCGPEPYPDPAETKLQVYAL
ncbi:helix-turn-helix domain-containing protein [Sphingosinicella rhizophila]|uniref:Helix-turn-helix domain-containing protein n=1 Tax=Sphingosinicella rhizophila TaxID=3050082 RepID=A0ABU3Q9Q7_9SPHN|nr:helix-turn-helix domain-containing protein [Sphingosinicella sp. GR2756]MDT9600140.1 helix-turn-helix domain-containing protein [Sphingosinicella sp. GR2756]